MLPKFKAPCTEAAITRPAQRVSGRLQADYFFGKPVADRQVRLEGYTFDVQRKVVLTLEGATDDTGD